MNFLLCWLNAAHSEASGHERKTLDKIELQLVFYLRSDAPSLVATFLTGRQSHDQEDSASWSNVPPLQVVSLPIGFTGFSFLNQQPRTPDDAWIVHDLVLVWMEATGNLTVDSKFLA